MWEARVGGRSPLLPSEGLSWMEEGEIINSLPCANVVLSCPHTIPNLAFPGPHLAPSPRLSLNTNKTKVGESRAQDRARGISDTLFKLWLKQKPICYLCQLEFVTWPEFPQKSLRGRLGGSVG